MYGMGILILLFCLMIGGSSAHFCDNIPCNSAPLKELARRNYILDETQLIRLCTPTLELFNCYSKYTRDCFEMELEELAASKDPYAHFIATKILEAKNLTIEACDKDSTLRKDYFENVDCYSRMFGKSSTICSEKAAKLSLAFVRKFRNLKEGDYVNYSERACLKDVYPIACLAEQLERSCGEVARRTFLTLLRKVKKALRISCDVFDPLRFKLSFLEYLKLEGKISEIYLYVFETF